VPDHQLPGRRPASQVNTRPKPTPVPALVGGQKEGHRKRLRDRSCSAPSLRAQVLPRLRRMDDRPHGTAQPVPSSGGLELAVCVTVRSGSLDSSGRRRARSPIPLNHLAGRVIDVDGGGAGSAARARFGIAGRQPQSARVEETVRVIVSTSSSGHRPPLREQLLLSRSVLPAFVALSEIRWLPTTASAACLSLRRCATVPCAAVADGVVGSMCSIPLRFQAAAPPRYVRVQSGHSTWP